MIHFTDIYFFLYIIQLFFAYHTIYIDTCHRLSVLHNIDILTFSNAIYNDTLRRFLLPKCFNIYFYSFIFVILIFFCLELFCADYFTFCYIGGCTGLPSYRGFIDTNYSLLNQ